MQWIEVSIPTRSDEIDDVCAQLAELGAGGMVVEDETDFQQFLEQNRQYWDYVDEDLRQEMQGRSRITFYLEAGDEGFAKLGEVRIALEELKKTVRLLSHVLAAKEVTKSEAVGLLRVITDYTYGLDTLDRYDYQQLEVSATTAEEPFRATYENAMAALQVLRDKFGGSALFAREKDESFKSTMGAIYQTFGGRDLYPSVEEKAANLLYLTVKNHSFSDGNKRIAAFLFLWFLENNRILYRPDGSRLLDNNTLVALTLMIAESRTEEKDVMTKVVVNLINKNN